MDDKQTNNKSVFEIIAEMQQQMAQFVVNKDDFIKEKAAFKLQKDEFKKEKENLEKERKELVSKQKQTLKNLKKIRKRTRRRRSHSPNRSLLLALHHRKIVRPRKHQNHSRRILTKHKNHQTQRRRRKIMDLPHDPHPLSTQQRHLSSRHV